LFVALVEPLEQFTHATRAVAQLELLLNPADCFGSTANITIEPGRELLLLLVSHPFVAADIAEARKRLFAASNKHSNPALEGFGMDMEDATDCIGILTTVKQEDGVQAATELRDQFEHGVCFVSLAEIAAADLVVSKIAQQLGLREDGSQPLLDILKDYLRTKQLLGPVCIRVYQGLWYTVRSKTKGANRNVTLRTRTR